jgi:ATP phosphoribosyltransferase regulatory subunit
MSDRQTETQFRRAASLIARFERAGYAIAQPAILQPAEPFLDLSGEDIRRRMYLTTDAAGRELCLRPDLTIPVASDYLRSRTGPTPAGFCYLGPVFRQGREGASEFLQAGIESFDRQDIAAADAEMVMLGLEASAHYDINMPEIRMGDVGLFSNLIAALDLAPGWKRRLTKDFNRQASLAHDLETLAPHAGKEQRGYHGVLAALAGSDPQGAHALVADLLSIGGMSTVGGRSVDEIADRFLEQAELGATAALPGKMRGLIERFLEISGDPDLVAARLRTLMREEGLALGPAIDLFDARVGFLAQRGLDVRNIRFSTAFGRGLDYYTGFVFELHNPGGGDGPLVAGGRYDALLTRLGSDQPIPAVGFAVWIDRLAQIRGGS